jgi:hypothetical protein
MTWVCTRLCKLQKGCTRLAVESDKVYQLLAHGRWFSLGTPASSTTKTGCHDIAEILLRMALNNKSINQCKSYQRKTYSVCIRYFHVSWILCIYGHKTTEVSIGLDKLPIEHDITQHPLFITGFL